MTPKQPFFVLCFTITGSMDHWPSVFTFSWLWSVSCRKTFYLTFNWIAPKFQFLNLTVKSILVITEVIWVIDRCFTSKENVRVFLYDAFYTDDAFLQEKFAFFTISRLIMHWKHSWTPHISWLAQQFPFKLLQSSTLWTQLGFFELKLTLSANVVLEAIPRQANLIFEKLNFSIFYEIWCWTVHINQNST